MTRTKAVVVILVGIGFGLLAIFCPKSALSSTLLAVSICLVLYGIYLYADQIPKDLNEALPAPPAPG